MSVHCERRSEHGIPRRRTAGRADARVAALVAALVLVALAAGAWPGAAAASSALDAASIDAFLTAQGSPMVGSGATFVAEGAEHGVDPAFLVAVTGAESSFGLFLYSSNGDEATYNPFNWFYAPTWSQADFASWDEAIAAVAAGIAGDLYYGSGLYSIYEIGPRYCPDGTANWLLNVALFMERLGGDPLDTRLTGGAPPPAAAGVLAVEGLVALSPSPYVVGDDVTARFTLVNRGDAAVEIADVRLAVRDPSGGAHDLATAGSLELGPGEAHRFAGTWSLVLPGEWHGWIELRYGDQRLLLGTARVFSIRARLPRDPELRRPIVAQLRLAGRL